MTKVAIATINTVVTDRRTLLEAELLARSGLQVVIIGLLGKNQPPYERMPNGVAIRRLSPTLNLRRAFLDRFFPIYKKKLPKNQTLIEDFWNLSLSFFGLLDRWLKPITVFSNILNSLLSEKADVYHAHHPVSIMLLAFFAAKIRKRRFVVDYNDILMLHSASISKPTYYDQENLWGKETLSQREQIRINDTLNLIPQDVSNIIDLGCGDGRITNRLSPYKMIVGTDLSRSALQHVKTCKVIASADALPFKEASFDLVITTEVLEHLPTENYCRATVEIQRVAQKYILLGTPWREQLSIGRTRCIHCGTMFHVNYHQRSFYPSCLKKVFRAKFDLKFQVETGDEKLYYHPLLLMIRRYLGGIWPRTPTTVCPQCGARLFPGRYPENNVISTWCNRRNEEIMHRKRLNKSHVIALYQRRARSR